MDRRTKEGPFDANANPTAAPLITSLKGGRWLETEVWQRGGEGGGEQDKGDSTYTVQLKVRYKLDNGGTYELADQLKVGVRGRDLTGRGTSAGRRCHHCNSLISQ